MHSVRSQGTWRSRSAGETQLQPFIRDRDIAPAVLPNFHPKISVQQIPRLNRGRRRSHRRGRGREDWSRRRDQRSLRRRRSCWHVNPIGFTSGANSRCGYCAGLVRCLYAFGEKCIAHQTRYRHTVGVVGSRTAGLDIGQANVLSISGAARSSVFWNENQVPNEPRYI